MNKNTYLFIARIILAYIFFVFGCYVLDEQTLFEVFFPDFNKAPESSFFFFLILLYISVNYIYKIKRNKSLL